MNRFLYIAAACMALFGVACGGGNAQMQSDFTYDIYTPRYAGGFDIRGNGSDSAALITVRNPWQGASGFRQELLVLHHGAAAPAGFEGVVVKAPVERVVCMSSSHVAMFDAVGAIGCVRGVSGLDLLSNDYIRRHRDAVCDVGYDTNLDFERLAAIRPDIVLLYGVTGENRLLTGKLRELRIPYIYVGDYVEQSPLGKAEWLMLAAELSGRRAAGIDTLRQIAARYEALKASVVAGGRRPRVMFNAPYRDTWFMPSTRSYVVQLVEDAGGEYLYPQNSSDSSVAIDLEEAYLLARTAAVWLHVGNCNTLGEVVAQNPKFATVDAVRNRRVWNNNRRQTPSGGSDFWESGVVRPDRVLSDLVAIFRGTDADTTYYYKRLE